jgi:cell division protein FtsI/penicillin-binding protein 2
MFQRVPSWLVPASALVLAGLALPRPPVAGPQAEALLEAVAPSAKVAGDIAAELPVAIDEIALDPATGRYVAPLGEGRAILTIDPRLQARLERVLEGYRVPWGATVLLEPTTGRILALAEHSRAEPGHRGLAVEALAPAASIFKLVTAAALLEAGVRPDEEVCYHGGRHRLAPRLLADDPRRDHRCATLADAFGRSTNVVFAKLAGRGLDPARLQAAADRFLFNVPIPFAGPVEVSKAEIPADAFGLATTAAGFGEVKLSPLHAALLAAIVANGGVLVPPVIVDRTEGAPLPAPGAPRRIVDAAIAAELAEMMRNTVTEGTARRAFRQARGALRGVPVAGKTGSLADAQPYRDYTWFVGYAPADAPQVAVATVIVNDRLWHARAPTVAREALEAYFATHVAGEAGAVRTAAVR